MLKEAWPGISVPGAMKPTPCVTSMVKSIEQVCAVAGAARPKQRDTTMARVLVMERNLARDWPASKPTSKRASLSPAWVGAGGQALGELDPLVEIGGDLRDIGAAQRNCETGQRAGIHSVQQHLVDVPFDRFAVAADLRASNPAGVRGLVGLGDGLERVGDVRDLRQSDLLPGAAQEGFVLDRHKVRGNVEVDHALCWEAEGSEQGERGGEGKIDEGPRRTVGAKAHANDREDSGPCRERQGEARVTGGDPVPALGKLLKGKRHGKRSLVVTGGDGLGGGTIGPHGEGRARSEKVLGKGNTKPGRANAPRPG